MNKGKLRKDYHPAIVNKLESLSRDAKKVKSYEERLRAVDKVREDIEGIEGVEEFRIYFGYFEHPDISVLINNLGCILLVLGKLKDALGEIRYSHTENCIEYMYKDWVNVGFVLSGDNCIRKYVPTGEIEEVTESVVTCKGKVASIPTHEELNKAL